MTEKQTKRKDLAVTGMLFCLMCGCMLCCGWKSKETQVVIRDGRVQTRLAVAAGTTVEEALAEAEIAVKEQDFLTPGRGEVLTDDDAEIVISRCAGVTVAVGGEEQKLTLTGATVSDALNEAGIALNLHDYVNHSTEAYLEDGMEIFVLRRNEVTLVVDGETRVCLTTAYAVDDLLAEQELVIDAKDRISPSGDTPLADGMEIEVKRVSVKTVKEREPIPFETKTEYSSELYKGESREKTAGVDGEKEITYEITYVNGKPGKKKAVGEKVIKEPVDQVILEGTKEKSQPKKPTSPSAPDKPAAPERTVVSKQKVPDCDGSGHGYYVITWSDGTVEYEDY